MKNWFPILAILSFPCFAQQDSIAPYFREFKDKISTQIFLLNTSNDFEIDYENDDLTVEIIPNIKTTLNIGFQYDIVSFSVGFAPKFFADNQDNKGSRMTSLSFEFTPGRWMQRLEYYNQKGMTLKTDGAPGLYFSRLESTKIGGSTNYFFNRKFSYRAIALQNVQQLRSAGSFSAGLIYYYTSLDGNDEPEIEGKTTFLDIAFTPAYHYNWVIGKHVNLVGGLSIGAGINFIDDEGDDTTSALYTSSLMLAPGYNSDRWFFGAHLRANYMGREANNGVNVGDSIVYATAFVGYRFDAPEFLISKTQQIKSKFLKENK
ncbi:MAG: DUF4421 domain-containing protein [Flavobacterium sp.]|uniref:DUF4421 family protein n=1 Tax=Flavobacterium sp. TaxID=239 RepID=UPI00120BE523|nr:DUF4421 family protein [Flavobacterium sp.]RZJ68426.1 MAG: DUF4421 domain-containing protein [Flavobacterium sp.]